MGKYSDGLLGAQPVAEQDGTQPSAPGKYSSELLGGPAPATQAAPTQQPEQPEQGWGEWLKESVVGKKDPAYEGTGSVYEQFQDDLTSPTATAAMLGASDPQMADIIAKNLGDRLIRREKDANGYDVFVTRGPDGQEQRGYVNQPGLDTQDMWRTLYGAAPYVVGGGAIGSATKGAGWGLQALAQGAGAGATSVAGDVAQIPMGSEHGVELPKAGIAAGLGAAAPPVAAAAGALWRRFVTVPGLYNSATGKLTEKGVKAAREAGVDPVMIESSAAEEFAKSFAKTGDAKAAATKATMEPYGIPATKGQISKDPYILTQEEKMRRRMYGEGAQDVIKDLDQRQMEAIRQAALGPQTADEPYRSNVPRMIAPGRKPGMVEADRSSASLGENIRSGLGETKSAAKAAEREAWSGTKDLAATKEALATLPERINQALADETRFTPTAQKMAETLNDFMSGSAPETAIGAFKLKPVQSVDQMRRQLFSIMKQSADPEDNRMASKVYDAFNDWIGEAAEKSLLAGDPAAAMKIVKARGFTRELNQLLKPTDQTGRLTPAAQRMAKVFDEGKADSGEAVVNSIFGPQGSATAGTGTVQTLKNVKNFLTQHASPETAKQTWDDIRLAYWTRLVQNKTGELFGPQAMLGNIRKAQSSQKSAMEVLFSPDERREIGRFANALSVVSYKPPNASGSGYTAGEAINEGLARLLDAFGLGRLYRAVGTKYGVGDALAKARARTYAEGMAGPTKRPNLAPALTITGSTHERQTRSK
jgi:hypothetical protein